MARVSQEVIERELSALRRLLAEHPDGLGRADLQSAYQSRFGVEITGRTMSRRLKALIQRGVLEAFGETNNRAYRLVSPGPRALAHKGGAVPPPVPDVPEEEEGDRRAVSDSVPYSAAARDAFRLVSRPRAEREPVTYNREFLGGYEPGETWYLDASLRAQLREIGRSPEPDGAAGTYARDILEHLLIDLSWSSSRLEGNTFSRLDTKNLLEFGEVPEGKDPSEAQMIVNHRAAIRLLVDGADHLAFDRRTVLSLHALLSENLLGDASEEGRLRSRMVKVTSSVFTPVGIPQVIEECFDEMLAKARVIPDPFEQAFFAMVHIPYLQPFLDVNKRTSRLAANIPLVRGNLCPLSFIDVPEHDYIAATLAVYELRRVEPLLDLFAWAYERSARQYNVVREAIGRPDPIRLRYRQALHAVVRDTVREFERPNARKLRARGHHAGVPGDDLDAFTERALEMLLGLNEGNAVGHDLSPAELGAWRSAIGR